ncbi:uncharacterized protein IL334_007559 [Kwoniella shivajii]|uniref:RING-type domain-containing protein n=1 Tax=Kwoniella shivajii TaxID=564305 RepID=A0ABZ1D9T8_9TREE|nr:hypothetical protein IL334_007559 [Kwoniella shivajii]
MNTGRPAAGRRRDEPSGSRDTPTGEPRTKPRKKAKTTTRITPTSTATATPRSGPIPTPYLALAPTPISSLSPSTIDQLASTAASSGLVLPSSYLRNNTSKTHDRNRNKSTTTLNSVTTNNTNRISENGAGAGPSSSVIPLQRPSSGASGTATRNKYVTSLLSPPTIIPGGTSSVPRIQNIPSANPRRVGGANGSGGGRRRSEERLREIYTNSANGFGNPSLTSLGQLGRILESGHLNQTNERDEEEAAEAEEEERLAQAQFEAQHANALSNRRRRRIVRGENAPVRRLTVSSREEGRALGIARSASMRRTNVWDDIPEAGEPPPPFPFPTPSTSRLPPTFSSSTNNLSSLTTDSDTHPNSEQRPRSPPPSFEIAIGLIPSPHPDPEALSISTSTPSTPRPTRPALTLSTTLPPPTTSEVASASSEQSPSSTHYASAPSSPTQTIIGFEDIREAERLRKEKQEKDDRTAWNEDLLAGYTLEERVKREMERRGIKGQEEKPIKQDESEEEDDTSASDHETEISIRPVEQDKTKSPVKSESVIPIEEDRQSSLEAQTYISDQNISTVPNVIAESSASTTAPSSPHLAQQESEPDPVPKSVLDIAQADETSVPEPGQHDVEDPSSTVVDPKVVIGDAVSSDKTSPAESIPTSGAVNSKDISSNGNSTSREERPVSPIKPDSISVKSSPKVDSEVPPSIASLPSRSLETQSDLAKTLSSGPVDRASIDRVSSKPSTADPVTPLVVPKPSTVEDNLLPVSGAKIERMNPATEANPPTAKSEHLHVPGSKLERPVLRRPTSSEPLFRSQVQISGIKLKSSTQGNDSTQGAKTAIGNDTTIPVSDTLAPASEPQTKAEVKSDHEVTQVISVSTKDEDTMNPNREAALKRRNLHSRSPVIHTPTILPPAPKVKVQVIKLKEPKPLSGPLINFDTPTPSPPHTPDTSSRKERAHSQDISALAASSAELLSLLELQGYLQEVPDEPIAESSAQGAARLRRKSSSSPPPPSPPPVKLRRVPPPLPKIDPKKDAIPSSSSAEIEPTKTDKKDIEQKDNGEANTSSRPPLPARRPPPPPPPPPPQPRLSLIPRIPPPLPPRPISTRMNSTDAPSTSSNDTTKVSSAAVLPMPPVRPTVVTRLSLSRPKGPRPPPPPPRPRQTSWSRLMSPFTSSSPRSTKTNDVPPIEESEMIESPLRPSNERAKSDYPQPPAMVSEQEEERDRVVERSSSAMNLRSPSPASSPTLTSDLRPGDEPSISLADVGQSTGTHPDEQENIDGQAEGQVGTRNGNGNREWTDLDLLVSRIESSGREFESFNQISSFLGPSKSQAATPRALDTLLTGLVNVDSRRTTPQGKVKLKLSLLGVRVSKCGICLSQFRGNEKGVMLPSCGHSGHETCARRWFRESNNCWVCREVLKEE